MYVVAVGSPPDRRMLCGAQSVLSSARYRRHRGLCIHRWAVVQADLVLTLEKDADVRVIVSSGCPLGRWWLSYHVRVDRIRSRTTSTLPRRQTD